MIGLAVLFIFISAIMLAATITSIVLFGTWWAIALWVLAEIVLAVAAMVLAANAMSDVG